MNEVQAKKHSCPGYSHFVFKAHGGPHDVGSPAADFEREEVVWAGLAEPTFGLRGLWGGNTALS